jgi:hypothetical protein
MNLILKIIQGNTSIPVVLCDEQDRVLSYNNIQVPENEPETYLKEVVKNPVLFVAQHNRNGGISLDNFQNKIHIKTRILVGHNPRCLRPDLNFLSFFVGKVLDKRIGHHHRSDGNQYGCNDKNIFKTLTGIVNAAHGISFQYLTNDGTATILYKKA